MDKLNNMTGTATLNQSVFFLGLGTTFKVLSKTLDGSAY